MRAGAAVGVDNDLAAGQAAIALRATDDKTAGWVDQILGVFGQHAFRQHRLDDLFNDGLNKRGLHLVLGFALVGAVLGRQHHGINAVRLAVDITHGDLAFRVGAQERQATVLAQLRLAFDQAVCVINRRGHQFGRFVAGITEHQALVTGAGIEVVVAGVVHALSDVIALLVIADHDRATLVVDAVFGVVVADAFDGVARHLDVIHMRVGGDLASQHHQSGVGQ